MEVIKVTPRGYCKGVVRAISIAKQCAQQYPDLNITVLGMLVHNEYVKKALERLNIRTIENSHKTREQLLDEINDGVVIFTAHGISDQVKQKAVDKGLICVDASCPDVVKTQELVRSCLNGNGVVFYIGKHHHPEAEAICSLSERVFLIADENEVPANITGDIFVTNQTTMSIFDIERIFDTIRKQYPKARFSEEICNATRIRQQAVASLKGQNVDVLYVVGDKHSNNSKRLAQIGREQGIPNVFLIDDAGGIKKEQLDNYRIVAVTSGASTPTYLTNQVIDVLTHWDHSQEIPRISIDHILG